MYKPETKSDRSGLKFLLIVAVWLAVLVGIVSTMFAQSTQPPKQTASDAAAKVDGMKVSGPYVHKNLAVYLIHSDKRDDREFLTLNEGLKSGKVKVSELKNEQVSRLMIENTSDKPLFLQEGDRVTGGKQDRTIYSSLVIAPKSGKQTIPSFCIEQSRWALGETGKAFTANANIGYASNGVRQAAKLGKSQGKVWEKVAEQKEALNKQIDIAKKTSSLNEAIDSKKIVASTKAYKGKLTDVLAKHGDAVGVAFALDGELSEINVFPGNPLVKKVYPRLLETYAVDAAISKKADKKAKPPTADAIKKMMKSKLVTKADRKEKLDKDNQLEIFASAKAGADKKHTYRCETKWGDKLVHLQWLKAEKAKPASGRNSLQRNFNNDLRNIAPQQRGNSAPRQQQEAQPPNDNSANEQ